MRILGIDPGSRVTGWGVVDADGWDVAFVGHGALRTSGDGLPGRLCAIATGLREVIDAERPEAVAVERVFTAKSARSALILGHARGVALLAAAEADLEIHEYTPMQVKNAVAGYGLADKAQVQRAVAMQLALAKVPRPVDAADALAIALCHAAAWRLARRAAAGREGAGGWLR